MHSLCALFALRYMVWLIGGGGLWVVCGLCDFVCDRFCALRLILIVWGV